MENENILIRKLERFIRKYYSNKVIRGTILCAGVWSVCYLLFVILESIFRFNNDTRSLFFYTFLIIVSTTISWLVILPLANRLKIGRRLTYEKAAWIIGKHFAEIEDKIINTLQLLDEKQKADIGPELLGAAVDQKITSLKVFDFKKVISFRKTLKYIRYTAPPVFIILLGFSIAPGLISEATKRILKHSTDYPKKSPFSLEIINPALTVFQQEDFLLKIKITGEEIPVNFFVETEEGTFPMKRNEPDEFSYLFKAVQQNRFFEITSFDYRSEKFFLRAFPKPIVLSFTSEMIYPSYTRKQREKLENTGDLIVPEGTIITWKFFTRDVDNIDFVQDSNRKVKLKKSSINTFQHTVACNQTFSYSVIPENMYRVSKDTMRFKITSLADDYPDIHVTEESDSVIPERVYFDGVIKDDYGFSKFIFNYEVINPDDTAGKRKIEKALKFNMDRGEERFIYSMDFTEIVEEPGDFIRYYFEIWDNDGIHGPKAAKSEIREIKTLTLNDVTLETNEKEKGINGGFQKSLERSRELQKSIDEINEKLIEQTDLRWQDNERIKNILEKQANLLETIEKIKRENLRNIEAEEKYLETGREILEKQKRLNEIMDMMLTEEMRKNIQAIKDLLQQADKDKLKDFLERMKITSKDLEEQLDRSLELFKDIAFTRKLEEVIREIRNSAREQERVIKNNELEKSVDRKEILQQKKLREEFDSIRQELKMLEEMEKTSQNPPGIQQTKEMQESISQTQNESAKQLENENRKDATKAQKKAAEQLQNLADRLEELNETNELEQAEEDAEQVRQILENLLNISFEQENLMIRTRAINRNDPKFQEIIIAQNEMQGKLKSARDSLIAIGKRQFMLQPVISRELGNINSNINGTIDALSIRSMGSALAKQQYTMTSLNNLSLLLDESIEKMNQNMALQMQGKTQQMCKNPSRGMGKKSMKNIKSMQQKISEKMQRIKQGMEKQKAETKKQPGNQENSSLNEEIARLAAEQEAIRRELEQYEQMLQKNGEMNLGGIKNAEKEMEMNERELVNKMINQETLMRQQRILTRLLEAEKAEQLREQEEKRESTEAKNQKIGNPEKNLKYKRERQSETEILRLKQLPINRFYQAKSQNYMIKIKE